MNQLLLTSPKSIFSFFKIPFMEYPQGSKRKSSIFMLGIILLIPDTWQKRRICMIIDILNLYFLLNSVSVRKMSDQKCRLTKVASFPFATFFLENFSIIFGSKSCIKISIVWSGSTSTCPDRYLSSGFKVYKYQQSL